MDSRRLQELRDVYARLSHQSTGAEAQAMSVRSSSGGATISPGSTDTNNLGTPGPSSSESPIPRKKQHKQQANQSQQRKQQREQQRQQQTQSPQRQPQHSKNLSGSADSDSTEADREATALRDTSLESVGASRPAGSLRARLSSAASWSGAGSSDGLGTGREYGETTSLPAGASSSRVALKGELEEQIGSWDFSAGKRRRGSSRNDRPLSPGARQDASTRVEQDDIGSEEVRAGIGIDLGVGVKRRRKPKREGSSFYHRSYFEWTDELMEHKLPERAWGPFVASIFELGLKHSSPKVLMKLMPPKAERLTTEHIKSRLQKYRLHAQRSKEEFLEFFNLRLKSKFADFVEREGWRQLSPRHGKEDDDHDDTDYDGVGEDGGAGAGGLVGVGGVGDGFPGVGLGDSGGLGALGGTGGLGALGGTGGLGVLGGTGGLGGVGGVGGVSGAFVASDSEEPAVVKVDGRMLGDIRDLGALCVKEQMNLQDILRHHIAAQLKLQAEIHEHLTATNAATSTQASATVSCPPHTSSQLDNDLDAVGPDAKQDEFGGESNHGNVFLDSDTQTNEPGGDLRCLSSAAAAVAAQSTPESDCIVPVRDDTVFPDTGDTDVGTG